MILVAGAFNEDTVVVNITTPILKEFKALQQIEIPKKNSVEILSWNSENSSNYNLKLHRQLY